MKRIRTIISSAIVVIIAFLAISHFTQATVLPIAGNTYNLSGSGVSGSATSITLQSFTIKQTGQKIVDSNLSDTFYLTLEPGSNTKQELASCTTVVQNSNGTATLSGCTRGLAPITPYTASTTLQFAHAGGVQVIFSDAPQFFNSYTSKENDETVTGSWSFPTPVSGSNAATKTYVDAFGLSGSLTVDKVVVAGTAGETFVAGNLLYNKTSDGRWYKAGTGTTEATDYTLFGIAQGAGSAGVAITGGVLTKGVDANQSGLTTGKNYFLGSSAGTIATATTTVGVGKAKSATSLYFDPYFYGVRYNTPNTFTGTTTLATTTVNAPLSVTGTTTFSSIPTIVDSSNQQFMWRLIASTTDVTSGLDIQNIPTTSTMLRVFIYISQTGSNTGLDIKFNGDTSATYTQQYASSTNQGNQIGANGIRVIPAGLGRAGLRVVTMDIFNFSTTTKITQSRATALTAGSNATTTSPFLFDVSGIWATSTAQQINRITATSSDASTFVTPSAMYVYGSSF